MLNRRKSFVPVLVFALFVTFTFGSSAMATAKAASTDQNLALKSLVGSWQGSNDVGVNFLLTFNRGKTYTVTFSIPGVGSAHGHGAWKRTGLNTFESTDVAFVMNSGDGSIQFLQTTQAAFTIGAGNDSMDIDLAVEIALPDGTPVDNFTSFATAGRIDVISFPCCQRSSR